MLSPYTYLAGALISLALWSALFIFRKDVRREMLSLSIIFSIFGVLMEWLIWTKDWWRPQTFTYTLVGIEDVIFAFAMGGISAVIYEEVFGQKLARLKKKNHPETFHLVLLLSLSIVLGNLSYFVFNYNSAASWVISIVIPTLVIWFLRKDLIKDSIYTGIILTALAFLGFAILNLFEPGFVSKWWLFDHLSGIVYGGMPLEDILWFFTLGMFAGPIYEFWQGSRLKTIRRSK